ncbi:FAD-dependent oxidoreductase [Streptomyces xanthophaeus]
MSRDGGSGDRLVNADQNAEPIDDRAPGWDRGRHGRHSLATVRGHRPQDVPVRRRPVAAGLSWTRFSPTGRPRCCTARAAAVQTLRHTGPGFVRVIRTPSCSGACGMHRVPLGLGVEHLGAANIVCLHPPEGPSWASPSSCSGLPPRSSTLARRCRPSGVGTRPPPLPLDRFPLLGPTGIDGLYVETGTYCDGFHSSPVIARLLAELILDPAARHELLTPFATAAGRAVGRSLRCARSRRARWMGSIRRYARSQVQRPEES